MLSEQFEKLKNTLPVSYNPFPQLDDRSFWDGVSKEIKKLYISEAEMYMKKDFPILNASKFMEFDRTGNRSNYQNAYNIRRQALNVAILAELIENRGRFIDFMIDIIWMMCEETTWIIPAHNYIGGYTHHRLPLPDFDRPIIDLMSADTGTSVAAALYFFREDFNKVTPQICKRAEYELDLRIIKAYRDHTDYWWMGFMSNTNEQLNNWNPWINSNILLTLLLIEKNPAELHQILSKVTQSLDAYIKSYPEDGGCDEGPVYWGRAGASLFECLEILYEYTNGKINIYDNLKIKNMCRFIYRAHIADDYYVNFADASPKSATNPGLIYRFGKQINDEKTKAFAVQQYNTIKSENIILGRFGVNRILRELLVKNELESYDIAYFPEKSIFLPDIQVSYLRAATDRGEIYIAAKGGSNHENHNHNDVGNFVVYGNGNPFIIDAGSKEYTKRTFGPQRYDIWTNCSLWHNVPEFNYAKQLYGYEYKAKNVFFNDSGNTTAMTMEIQDAYPKSSEASIWKRSISLNAGTGLITIADEFKFIKKPANIRFTLLSYPKPLVEGCNIILESGESRLLISIDKGLRASYEEIVLEDEKLIKNWGSKLYRISLTAIAPPIKGMYKTEFKLI